MFAFAKAMLAPGGSTGHADLLVPKRRQALAFSLNEQQLTRRAPFAGSSSPSSTLLMVLSTLLRAAAAQTTLRCPMQAWCPWLMVLCLRVQGLEGLTCNNHERIPGACSYSRIP